MVEKGSRKTVTIFLQLCHVYLYGKLVFEILDLGWKVYRIKKKGFFRLYSVPSFPGPLRACNNSHQQLTLNCERSAAISASMEVIVPLLRFVSSLGSILLQISTLYHRLNQRQSVFFSGNLFISWGTVVVVSFLGGNVRERTIVRLAITRLTDYPSTLVKLKNLGAAYCFRTFLLSYKNLIHHDYNLTHTGFYSTILYFGSSEF